MTLARQMYQSYVYLVVDLKPTTVDSLRLRTDALKYIRRQELDEIIQAVKKQAHHSTDQTYEYIESMPSCDDCGQVYKDIHCLQMHVK